MAKNYTYAEAVAIIAEGMDMEAIQDIARRYPIMAVKTADVAAKAGNAFVELMGYLPEYMTANKMNSCIKKVVLDGESEEGEDGEAPAEEKAEKKEKVAAKTETKTSGGSDYESMNGKSLYAMVNERGLRANCNGDFKKDNLIKVLEADDKGGKKAEATAAKAKAKAEEVKEADAGSEYDGMSPQDLFKECKKRGIEVETKKAPKYYIEKLLKDDAKSAKAADEDEENWDDGEVEEKPKVKKSEKAEKKADAKSAKKDKEEDDDWDI